MPGHSTPPNGYVPSSRVIEVILFDVRAPCQGFGAKVASGDRRRTGFGPRFTLFGRYRGSINL